MLATPITEKSIGLVVFLYRGIAHGREREGGKLGIRIIGANENVVGDIQIHDPTDCSVRDRKGRMPCDNWDKYQSPNA